MKPYTSLIAHPPYQWKRARRARRARKAMRARKAKIPTLLYTSFAIIFEEGSFDI